MKHEIAELLPFYANGTLDAADRARVEAELATCPACANELSELRTLAAALRSRAAATPPLAPSVLADALARIEEAPTLAPIDETPLGRAVINEAPSGNPQFAEALRVRTLRARVPWWSVPARYATAAALVVGFGATAAAALHAYESSIRGHGANGAGAPLQGAAVYRYTPAAAQNATVRKLTITTQHGAASPIRAEKQHRLAKRADLSLLVHDVEGALKNARATVHAEGGDITGMDDSTPRTTGEIHEGTLDAEVPADKLDATLDALAALGATQHRSVSAEDLDATIVDEEARLRNLRHEEEDLRRLMDRGGKVGDVLEVQQNLSDVRGQIEELEAAHRNDVHRVATSTITLQISEDRPDQLPAKPGPSARIDGAWHSGLTALADTITTLLAAIAWCIAYAPIPLAVIAAGGAITRIARTRAGTS